MLQDELKTPFGSIRILRNGQTMRFEAEKFVYNDAESRSPQGMYFLNPDMAAIRNGDIISCDVDGVVLDANGSGENYLNSMGIYHGYTIGLGAVDFRRAGEYWPTQVDFPPYETDSLEGLGLVYRIVDEPEKYAHDTINYQLYFVVAWEPGETDEAWDLVDSLTC